MLVCNRVHHNDSTDDRPHPKLGIKREIGRQLEPSNHLNNQPNNCQLRLGVDDRGMRIRRLAAYVAFAPIVDSEPDNTASNADDDVAPSYTYRTSAPVAVLN